MKILPFAGSQIVLDYADVASKIGYWREHLPHFTISNSAALDRVTKSVAQGDGLAHAERRSQKLRRVEARDVHLRLA
jgi:hypothetical protein